MLLPFSLTIITTILAFPEAKSKMSLYFTATNNRQKNPEAKIHFSDGESPTDLSVSRNWMEHVEHQETHGGPGAYDVLRCDMIQKTSSPSATLRVWGKDYHLDRLEKSYKELVKHLLPSKGENNGDKNLVQDNAVKAAHKESDAIMNSILEKMLEHEEYHIKEVAAHDQKAVCDIIRVTILWTPSSDHIIVRGHASSSGQILAPNKTPKYIVATVALPKTDSSRQSAIIDELPNRHISPHAKISSWSSSRRSLEKKETFMPDGIGEVLLLKKDVNSNKMIVLEGLTSNFFAIYHDGSIRTAADGVLLGYVRHLILECANKCGLRVDERPIDLEDGTKGLWAETFITSSSRLIYPINKILIPDYGAQIGNESSEALNWKTYWELDEHIDTKDHIWYHLFSEILQRGGY